MVVATPSSLDLKVLCLNRLYMAVRVVSSRRAFCLLANQRAEVINVEAGQYVNYDFETWIEIGRLHREVEPEAYDWVRTVRMPMPVPKIIRLHTFDRLPRPQVKLNRRNILARDEHCCQYCDRVFPLSELSIDHVIPRSQGGGDTWENLVCACHRCNARKGGRTPAQANMTLRRRPARPRRHPLVTMRVARDRYACWEAFLAGANWSVEFQ